MVLNFDVIKEDIEAFADDVSDVITDRKNASFLFTKNGEDYVIKIIKKDNIIKNVEFQENIIPYKKFLSKHLARLDSFAQKIHTKRKGVTAFIDGPAKLDLTEDSEKNNNTALELLQKECCVKDEFNTKIIFITADAGHGKTALLREFQSIKAKEYLDGKSEQLFWHIDLQGRQLLRLTEAFMGDLGELRFTGLWMQSIIRLMKHGLLVIGIDGFDELAAEQGTDDALGALALLVNSLKNTGIIVAASRRTFFDSENYLKKTRFFDGKTNQYCSFSQITLRNWTKNEISDYAFTREIKNSDNFYDEVYNLLGRQSNHPLITRPFLISQLVNAITKYNISASDFIGGMSNPEDPNKGVNSLIEAFIKREVKEKWKDKETGEPYLNQEQHKLILSSIAEEMWKSQTEKIQIDIIQTLVLLLLDEWGIDESRRMQVFEMVKMHALLVFPIDGNHNYRLFEHAEFKDYFTSISLKRLLIESLRSSKSRELSSFLSTAQISDSVALYTFSNAGFNNSDIEPLISLLQDLVKKEWKPTFININVGTMIPFILNTYDLEANIEINSKIVYTSLVFENKNFKNFTIKNGTFLNTSFKNSKFCNVKFMNCEMHGILFNQDSKFEESEFVDCKVNGIKKENNSKIECIEYSPKIISTLLIEMGIKPVDTNQSDDFNNTIQRHKYSIAIHRLLRSMRRTTFISKNNINNWFKEEKRILLNDIIPLMEKHKILDFRKEKRNVWTLKSSHQKVSLAEYEEGDSNTHNFWKELRNKF